jgi:quinoprotein glucose dehydrogenase
VWVFHTVPERGEAGAETWPDAALATGSGVHNWAELTVDEDRGIVFIPTGTARYDFYGGNRHGANLYANSVLALDAKTGKRIWHFQAIHHDLWDYDLATAPKLLTVRHEGRDVDVVAQASKHGFLFVLERDSGRPLWPIEERPVPQSDVPGEQTSPTQPFPTVPPPFARQSFTEKDINPYLPAEAQERLRQLLSNSVNKGLFTPPSLQGTIQMPGNSGGANWGLSAVDPVKGRVYVMSKESPDLLTLRAMKPGDKPEDRGADVRQLPPDTPPGFVPYTAVDPYGFTGDKATGMPPLAPPWSQLTAYDLNKGTILWQVPNGDSQLLTGRGVSGTGNHQARAGMVVTAGGLVFIGTPDNTLRAYGEDSGKVVWEKQVSGPINGVPSVYEMNGRQYLAVAVGAAGTDDDDSGQAAGRSSSEYVVFALRTN